MMTVYQKKAISVRYVAFIRIERILPSFIERGVLLSFFAQLLRLN